MEKKKVDLKKLRLAIVNAHNLIMTVEFKGDMLLAAAEVMKQTKEAYEELNEEIGDQPQLSGDDDSKS